MQKLGFIFLLHHNRGHAFSTCIIFFSSSSLDKFMQVISNVSNFNASRINIQNVVTTSSKLLWRFRRFSKPTLFKFGQISCAILFVFTEYCLILSILCLQQLPNVVSIVGNSIESLVVVPHLSNSLPRQLYRVPLYPVNGITFVNFCNS